MSSSTSSKSASTTSSSELPDAPSSPEGPLSASPAPAFGFRLLLVHRLAKLHGGLGECVGLGLQIFEIVAIEHTLEIGDRLFDRCLVAGLDLLTELAERLLGRVDQAVRLVPRLDQLLALLILFGVLLGLLDHALDLFLVETAGSLDADLLLLAGRLVLGRDVDDAVGVDVEGDLDLRHAARGGRDADEIELAEHLVIGRHLALALEDPDGDRVLIVIRGREHLALLGGDRRVAIDDPGKDTAQRLDAERQRGDVEKKDVLDLAGEHRCLNGSADRDDLVRVHALVRILAEEVLDRLDHLGHARHAADQDDLVDIAGAETGVLQRLLAGIDGAIDQIADQHLQLGAADLERQMLRPGGVRGDEGQVDLGLRGRGELDLGFLSGFLQTLQRQLVAAKINALILLELIGHVVDQAKVEVLTAEEGVTIGGLHLEDAVADLEDRDVEGTAAEVVDRDGLGVRLVEAVGERCRRRLVDDAQNLEAGDLAGVLGGLALAVIEVGRDRDHSLVDGLAEMTLRRLLHLLQRWRR